MARLDITLVAALSVLAVVAMAQPDVVDLTRTGSYQHYMPVATYGDSIEQNTSLIYTSIDVPFNAYFLGLNLSGPYCLDYSVTPPDLVNNTLNWPDLEFMVSHNLPCSNTFAQIFASTGYTPGVFCNGRSAGYKSKYVAFF